jgi:hypothetical protein
VIWWPAHGLQAVGDLEDLTEPPPWLLEQLTSRGKVAEANGHRGINTARCRPQLEEQELEDLANGKAGISPDDPWTTDPANLLGEFMPAPLSEAEVPEEIGVCPSLLRADRHRPHAHARDGCRRLCC